MFHALREHLVQVGVPSSASRGGHLFANVCSDAVVRDGEDRDWRQLNTRCQQSRSRARRREGVLVGKVNRIARSWRSAILTGIMLEMRNTDGHFICALVGLPGSAGSTRRRGGDGHEQVPQGALLHRHGGALDEQLLLLRARLADGPAEHPTPDRGHLI